MSTEEMLLARARDWLDRHHDRNDAYYVVKDLAAALRESERQLAEAALEACDE